MGELTCIDCCHPDGAEPSSYLSPFEIHAPPIPQPTFIGLNLLKMWLQRSLRFETSLLEVVLVSLCLRLALAGKRRQRN